MQRPAGLASPHLSLFLSAQTCLEPHKTHAINTKFDSSESDLVLSLHLNKCHSNDKSVIALGNERHAFKHLTVCFLIYNMHYSPVFPSL